METVTSKANGRLKQGFDKKTGKGPGKGGGEGKGLPSSTFDKASKLFDHYRHVVRYEQEYPDHIEVGIFKKILEKGLSYDTLVSDIEEYASELDGKHGESPELFYERYAEVNHE